MSYTILFKSMNIQTSKGILVMVQHGSNNLRDWSNKVVRDWGSVSFRGKRFFKDFDEFKNSAIRNFEMQYRDWQRKSREEGEGDWVDKASYGYYAGVAVGGKSTHKTTLNDIKNFYKSGFNFIVTIEEAIEKGFLYVGGKWVDGKQMPYNKVESEQMLFDAVDNDDFIVYRNGADLMYETLHKFSSMQRGGGERISIKVITDDGVKYVSAKDNRPVLVDNAEEAGNFKRIKYDMSWLIFRTFPGISQCIYTALK